VILGAANCPHPPLLLPGITGRPVEQVELLRSACLAAISQLMAARPSRVVIVGGAGPAEFAKPLSVQIGRSLLDQAGCRLPIQHLVVANDSPPADCLQAGRELAAGPERTGLLVMADGSARRSVKAPGYLDERAAPFDAAVLGYLREADSAGLAGLDPELAADLLVAGRAAWQVLAGAFESNPQRSTVHYTDDPFGVWYPVLSWRPVAAA
jgi:hypothetical protein